MADSAAGRDAIVGSTCAAGATGGAAAMNMTPPTRQHALFTMWLHSVYALTLSNTDLSCT